MAYMLTVLLISVLSNSRRATSLRHGLVYLVVQLVVGRLSGYLIGRLAVWTLNKINWSTIRSIRCCCWPLSSSPLPLPT